MRRYAEKNKKSAFNGYFSVKEIKMGKYLEYKKKCLFLAIASLFVFFLYVLSLTYRVKLNDKELVEKYFKTSQINFTDRKASIIDKSSGSYYHAIYCFYNNKCEKAMDIFERLVEEDVTFKESSMWYLIGCYLLTDQDKGKTINLLRELIELNGRYSSLASEVLDYKVAQDG